MTPRKQGETAANQYENARMSPRDAICHFLRSRFSRRFDRFHDEKVAFDLHAVSFKGSSSSFRPGRGLIACKCEKCSVAFSAVTRGDSGSAGRGAEG